MYSMLMQLGVIPGPLGLAGTGLRPANRQIAQALFVTQRTVENHLTSSYAKLGISSRSALPAVLGGSHPAGTPAPAR
jgi:hypothetical protein